MSNVPEFGGRGRYTPAGQTSYSPAKFQPSKARRERPGPYEGNPFDQTLPGEALSRGSDKEERVRPAGNLPLFLLPEEHIETIVHPQYEVVCRADGEREFYIISEGYVRCTCGNPHRKYIQPWDELPVAQAGEVLIDWPADMLPPEPVQSSVPEIEAAAEDYPWWEDQDEE